MTFHYSTKPAKVIDDETGIEVCVRGQTEWNLLPFEFFDPRISTSAFRSQDRFGFFATPVQHVEEIPKADGSIITNILLDGYQLDRKNLWVSFMTYTDQDAARFQKLCELLTSGLKVWLRHRGSAEDPVILIV